MIQISTEFDEEVPRWDVALESLLNEEHHKLGRALRIDDFHHLAAQHAIRFDDIMATMFELVLNGNWRYADHDDPRPLRPVELGPRDAPFISVFHVFEIHGLLSFLFEMC